MADVGLSGSYGEAIIVPHDHDHVGTGKPWMNIMVVIASQGDVCI